MSDKTKNILKELGIDPLTICSCYYCISHYVASEIEIWTNDTTPQAICPKCMIDSVIVGDIPDDILEKKYDQYFNTYRDEENHET